ncbi:unnamed protein product [Orchesella dallaii]|uniref:Protein zer-1 n=1 Tax=Orchesella dallaii TaxID=48710 RepID=A0ABP1QWH7_9HEXA
MGFHDNLYGSSYYNEEELLQSDDYPPPLVNLCARYCVNHLSKTLLEKIPSEEPIEPQITSNFTLRAGVRLPSELSEKIFSYLDKHTTTAELLRYESSSSSSSGSSTSEEEEVEEQENNDLRLIDARGIQDRNLLEEVERRRVARQRRRRRRRRRRIEHNERGGRRKMLWNGYGAAEPGDPEIIPEAIEVIGFDAIVQPLFGNPLHLPLTKLNLRDSTALTDELLLKLLVHKPRELDIHDCPKLTSASLDGINANSQNLVSLNIGSTTQLLPSVCADNDYFLVTPKLMKLVVWNLNTNIPMYWNSLTGSFSITLTSLDLSGCGEFEDFEFLRKFQRLRSLVLYNVLVSGRVVEEADEDAMEDDQCYPHFVLVLEDDGSGDENIIVHRRRLEKLVNKLVGPICQLKELRHLDISTSVDPSSSSLALSPNGNNLIGSVPLTPWSNYPNPNQILSTIVQNLPHLSHLDISGTNLAGRGVAVRGEQEAQTSSTRLCDIPGLNCRVDNPLEFLGLYGTAHDASHRHCIPAKRVSGDKDECQILVACEAYIHRHEVLEKVLNDLFHLFRSERGTHITQSLRLILRAMNLHPSEKHVQISGSASLFYIVKNEQHVQGGNAEQEVINPPMKRMILSTIVNAMAIHKVDSTMARNGCLTICHFRIPQDVMFIYAKLVKILLKILGQSIGPHHRHESFVERIAIYLLNSLACQVEGWHKRLVGDLGAMKRMLQLIRDRLSRPECDDVMEIAWSTMWNVTDETPENCEKFLKNEGMVLFLKCLQTFPNKPELLRNMMGLLGNVAEVGGLRNQLMTSEFISVFCELLDSTQDNIEVSYNAAGVLAHILSDGEEAWTITTPSRNVIQESMVRNVNRWNINSTRNINYRSFEPILRLLRIAHTRECQLWAAWALANLTRVYPEKYVPLVEKENGLPPLNDLLSEPGEESQIHENVKKYARITLRNVDEFNKNGKIDLSTFMDG